MSREAGWVGVRAAGGLEAPGYDRTLVLTVLCLMGISVVLISSASVMEAMHRFGNPRYFMYREVAYNCMALVLGLAVAMVPIRFWRRHCFHCMFITIALLVLVLAVGSEINEARRWINLGFFHLQPAEVLKFTWILYFSSYVSRKISEVQHLAKGFLKPIAFVAVITCLLLAQPDFGSLVVVTIITGALLLVSGAGLAKFFILGVITAVAAAAMVITSPYRMRRVLSFLDPWEDKFGAGYQLSQSLIAFGRGGVTGEGLGNSVQKLGYLPEAHTDFVTAILGEELGFVGLCVVIFLELVLVVKAITIGFRILRRGPFFEGYVAMGVGILFCSQTFINIGAASGALPTKGLTLPFISYGGSALFMSMAAAAVLLRVDFEARHGLISKDNREDG